MGVAIAGEHDGLKCACLWLFAPRGRGEAGKKKKREAHAGRARLAPVGGRVMPA